MGTAVSGGAPLAIAFPREEFSLGEVRSIARRARRDLGGANRVETLPRYHRLTLRDPQADGSFVAASATLADGRSIEVVDYADRRARNPAPLMVAAVGTGVVYKVADHLITKVHEWMLRGAHLAGEPEVQERRQNPTGYTGTGTVCVDGDGSRISCYEPGAEPTDLIMYRPIRGDGSRPRVYLDTATEFPQTAEALADMQEDLASSEGPRRPFPRASKGRVAKTALGGLVGAPAEVVYQDDQGDLQGQPAVYRLVEADRLIPSHTPESFQRHPMYPPSVQERSYHSDPEERDKVLTQTAGFRPDMAVNNAVEAVVGPPVMLPDGVVLGGNSRTMTMQRVYLNRPKMADALRAALRSQARTFGFAPGDVGRMRQPVLVREVQVDSDDGAAMRKWVRLYNEGFTQGMDLSTRTVAESVKLGRAALDEFASAFTAFGEAQGGDEPPTVTDFLTSAASKPFVSSLSSSGFIRRQERRVYVRPDGVPCSGCLTKEGREYLLRAMLGTVVRDPLVLDGLTDTLRDGLAAAVPYAFQASEAGGDWDLLAPLADAIELRYEMHVRDLRHPEELWRQESLVDKRPQDPVALALLDVLAQKGTTRALPLGFKRLAARASHHDTSQVGLLDMLGEPTVDVAQAVRDAWDLKPRAPKRAKRAKRAKRTKRAKR